MPELFYVPMQGVQPDLPMKNCPRGLRQHSSMLAALNSLSVLPQFNSPGLEPGVVKHLTCTLPNGIHVHIWLVILTEYPVQHARP